MTAVLSCLSAGMLLLAVGYGGCRLRAAAGRAAGADWGRPWLNRLDGLNRLYCRRFHRLHADVVPLPEHGPALVVANHVSGIDPLLLMASFRRPLRFIIATEQYRRPLLHRLFRAAGCIPVDRKGRPEQAFRAARRALERGEVVALFPQGHIRPAHEPMPRLKPGVARLAQIMSRDGRYAGAPGGSASEMSRDGRYAGAPGGSASEMSRDGRGAGGPAERCPIYAVRIDGVAGQGWVLAALFARSRARLTGCPPLHCEDVPTARCLEEVAARIGRPAAGA